MPFREHKTLGRTGLPVSRIGLAGGYGISAGAVEKAHDEYGINYFYWVARKPGMGTALRKLARRDREKLVIAIQSYDHLGLFLKRSVEKALSDLDTDYVDLLFLGWFNRAPGRRLMESAQGLLEAGKARFLGVTGHNRTYHGQLARSGGGPFDVLQVRYNAAHRGAETEVFLDLPQDRPGISVYTATRWGKLLKARAMPKGEAPLTAAECYRFALSHPSVDNCLSGPRDQAEMLEGLKALSAGPLEPDELERIRRIGDYVHG